MGSTLRAEPSASERAVARELVPAAADAETAGRWKEAADLFKKATDLHPLAILASHAGYCLDRSGQLVEAAQQYDRAIVLLAGERDTRGADEIKQRLDRDVAELRRRTPTLLLQLARAYPDLRVEIDGKPVAAAIVGRPMPMNPGDHTIGVASTDDYEPVASRVKIDEGTQRIENIVLPPTIRTPVVTLVPHVSPQQAQNAHAGSAPWRTPVVVGAGAAALVGAIMLIEARVAFATADQQMADGRLTIRSGPHEELPHVTCYEHPNLSTCRDLDQATRARDAAQFRTGLGTGLLVGGGILAASTWLLWQTSRTNISVDVGARAVKAEVSF